LVIKDVPDPKPAPKELKVNIRACALNHRDHFLRQHLYPGIAFGIPLLADGVGTVTAVGSSADKKWANKRVILTPSQGWDSSPEGPEGKFAILGGTKTIPIGTAQEVMVIDQNEVEEAPAHLTDAEAAALPLTGLTAWRAFVTKSGNAVEGRNILITGIGGGVALNALQFAVAKGCNVYVTSSSEEKIEKAKKLGAKGGVNYKSKDWDKELLKMLPKDRPTVDAVVDGAGGDIVNRAAKILKVSSD
jgi:NADPH:quinone reductase-like Zn-dependent oxidoreductase